MKIEFLKHNLGQSELTSIKKVFHSIFLTTGPATEQFEKEFAKYLDCRYVIGVNSCTAALHLCLVAYNIGPGDEVITTPLSFASTANAILFTGAKPIFVDVEESTGNINADLIENKITKKTKAIIPVHLYGQMANMKVIRRIAKKHKLIVIEDAAHCIEGKRDNLRPAQASNCACFSFHAIKTMTCGEGGAVATNDKKIAQKIKDLRNHGMTLNVLQSYRHKGYVPRDMKQLGYKYNLSDIHSAILLPQIKYLEKRLAKRKALAKLYLKELRNIKGIKTLVTKKGVKHALNSFNILVDPKKRNGYVNEIKKQGIGVIVSFYPIIPLLSYYKRRFGFRSGQFPVAEKISKSIISLPFYPKLKDSEILQVIKTLKTIIQ